MVPARYYHRVADRYARIPSKVSQSPRRGLQLAIARPGESPYEVAFETAIVRLRRYRPPGGPPPLAGSPARRPPILVVYPFINDPSILDFRADRSVIGGYLQAGFPVYVVEWLDASPVDRSIGLGDFVCRYLADCLAVVREMEGADDVHLHGYSTGAPLAAAYAALEPADVRTLLLQGPPLSFDADDGVELLRTIAAHLDLDRIVDRYGAIPAPIVESAFLLRKPVEYAITNPARLWDDLDDAAYVEDFGRKLAWARGGPDVPGELLREFVENLVVENRLIGNELRLRETRVDLERVTMPVLLVLGRDDDFVPPDASRPFLEAIPSTDTTTVEVPTGHVGLSTAAVAHDRAWPAARDWLSERS